MSDQFYQLVETVEKASVSNDWQGAKSEWDVVDVSEAAVNILNKGLKLLSRD